MKVIPLTRPALDDPLRELELRMRESQSGLADFTQALSPPSGWLKIEILSGQEEPLQVQSNQALSSA